MVAAILNLFNSITFPGSGNMQSLGTSGVKGNRAFEIHQGTDGFSYYLKIYSNGLEATRVVGSFASVEEAIDYLNENY
jgi:hypothetical protein